MPPYQILAMRNVKKRKYVKNNVDKTVLKNKILAAYVSSLTI